MGHGWDGCCTKKIRKMEELIRELLYTKSEDIEDKQMKLEVKQGGTSTMQ